MVCQYSQHFADTVSDIPLVLLLFQSCIPSLCNTDIQKQVNTLSILLLLFGGISVVFNVKNMKHVTLWIWEWEGKHIYLMIYGIWKCALHLKNYWSLYLTFVVYSLSNLLKKGFNGKPEQIKNTQKFNMSGA